MTGELQPRDLLRDGHGYSRVKGFRLQDFSIGCPFVEGRLCPEKIEIVSEYTSHIKKNSDGLAEEAPQNQDDCSEQLRQFDMLATTNGCEEAVFTECPVSETIGQETAMTYSSIALLAARKVLGIVGLIK